MLEIVPDTNIWRGLSHKDALLFEEFLRNTPAVCLLSSPARIEIVSHLGDNTSADFGPCKAAIRKIVRLCSRNQILVPEVEFLENIGFSHYIDPEWDITTTDAQDYFRTLENIITADDNTIIDVTKTFEKKQTDVQSMICAVNSNRDSFTDSNRFWCNFLEFFILVRVTIGPTKGKTCYKDLTPKEQETFKGAYAFRFLFNHLDEEIKKLGANLDMMVDGNHAYDTLQLLLLEKENRILITNEKTFHNSRERVPRIMRWVDFKNSYLVK